MKFRCPYCRHVFDSERPVRCPSCRKSMLGPGFYAARRDHRPAPAGAAPAWSPPRSIRAGHPFAFGRHLFRLGLVVVGLLFLGSILVHRSRRRPPDTEGHRREVARRNLNVLHIALDQLRADCGRYPRTAEGLVSLVHDPGLQTWRGPYIFELKPDPWGRPFGYRSDGDDVLLFTAGPDGIPETGDDIRHTPQAAPAAERVRLYPARLDAPTAAGTGGDESR